MTAANQSSARHSYVEDRNDVLVHLADEIHVLRDALDNLRDEISYAIQNARNETSSVLKKMAVDATAEDWSEQLVISHGAGQSFACGPAVAELEQAREVIRKLLGVCELNLDEMEDETRLVIRHACSFLPESKDSAESKPDNASAGESSFSSHPSGQLF